jgi:hypothetical protein
MDGWKRAMLPERLILELYARPFERRYPADEVLARETGAPLKVVWAAMWREDGKGHLDYGTNLRGGWLTSKGEARLAELRRAGRADGRLDD